MGVEEDFKAAADYVRSQPKDGPFQVTDDEKLLSELS